MYKIISKVGFSLIDISGYSKAEWELDNRILAFSLVQAAYNGNEISKSLYEYFKKKGSVK